MMATKFEQGKKDIEKKSYGKEGSKREEAADKRQMPKMSKMIVVVAKPMKKK
jgi:hypothetical protein